MFGRTKKREKSLDDQYRENLKLLRIANDQIAKLESEFTHGITGMSKFLAAMETPSMLRYSAIEMLPEDYVGYVGGEESDTHLFDIYRDFEPLLRNLASTTRKLKSLFAIRKQLSETADDIYLKMEEKK